ncbi:hydroxylase accessory protein YqeC [Spirochaetia bacterium]|nr:hydroxylase accessory protein YqeC [Spirochaetia bacterium]
MDPETNTLPKQPYPVRSAAGLVDSVEPLSAPLSAWFEEEFFRSSAPRNLLAQGRVLTVIGSGGKTSLIWHLARHLRGGAENDGTIRKILVTPTTKMLVPSPPTQAGSSGGFYDHYCNEIPIESKNGIILAGRFNEETGKLESLPLDELERIVPDYDLVLIEGDGSRGLPLKGWAEYEPAVPPFTTITVGILPLMSLGMRVSETIVHRLPLFCALSDAQEGDILKPEHLVRVITGHKGAKGLFAEARGKKILFFNQVEDEKTLERAGEVVSLLPGDFRSGLGGIIAGSVQKDRITCF